MKNISVDPSTGAESKGGFPVQLVLLAAGIVIGLIILVMEFSGVFSGGR